MTALDLPDFGIHGNRRAVTVRGRWSLVPGGGVQTLPRAGTRALTTGFTRKLLARRDRVRALPLVSGALIVGDPVHLTVGEIAVAVDKTRSVRLTIAEVTALGNRRFAVELIVSALGDDAGPDEVARLEGYADRGRDGSLRVTLNGPAPTGLGGAGSRIRLSAAFAR
ncbi:MAG TPA: hypothetical protein VGS97_28440 [Actinocrinis sp.]|uniref:hypothetical protein n=1 Tax=Actinocrinis sp. TaxID=1920516 RepID=UPI002DDCCB7C|nr:hypothetical protein [Actinocrinis sp.]HEV2348049.1 hypothetical protein [Actinocrinis sp.]